jgi:hypothetical protein
LQKNKHIAGDAAQRLSQLLIAIRAKKRMGIFGPGEQIFQKCSGSDGVRWGWGWWGGVKGATLCQKGRWRILITAMLGSFDQALAEPVAHYPCHPADRFAKKVRAVPACGGAVNGGIKLTELLVSWIVIRLCGKVVVRSKH